MPILIVYIIILINVSADQSNYSFDFDQGYFPGARHANLLLFIIFSFGLLFVFDSFIYLKKYEEENKHNSSTHENINFRWLRIISLGVVIIWMLYTLDSDHFFYKYIFILIIVIGYFGIKQVDVLSRYLSLDNFKRYNNEKNDFDSVSITQMESTNFIKYQKSGLEEDQGIEIQRLMNDLVCSQKLYLNPELNLGKLAQILNIHSNLLSQVINQYEKRNYHDYINTLRVYEFQNQIEDHKNMKFTLLTVAFNCGFNSKSSFNKYFKKVTNLTPSEYLSLVQPKKQT